MADIYEALKERKNMLIHAPTGMGKTDGALSPALTFALEQDLTVFFLTPKISQHKIVVNVVEGINEKHGLEVRVVDVVGKSHCCIEPEVAELEGESFNHACAQKIKKRSCKYYTNALVKNKPKVSFHIDAVKKGRECVLCPYEILIDNAKRARVVICDYYHLFISGIREHFLTRIGKGVDDAIIIVDEAHNLAGRLRESLSRRLSNLALRRVAREFEMLGREAGPLEEGFVEWANALLGNKKEVVVEEEEFVSFIENFGIPYEEVLEVLVETGEEYVERFAKRSACLQMAAFLESWHSPFSSRVLTRDEERIVLERRQLDVSAALSVLNQCYSSILMSATFLPLEMHRDVLGVERAVLKRYQSPFSRDSILHVVSDRFTTRFEQREERMFSAIAAALDRLFSLGLKTAVFFPSYAVLEEVVKRLKTECAVQRRKKGGAKKAWEQFLKCGRLCAVQGGALAEGVDYDGLQLVVVVGVALEEMTLSTKALIDFYEKRFGRGWDYAYIYPAVIKGMQAAGRGRRKESDRVVVLYLDERFLWKKYKWVIPPFEPKVVSNNLVDEVKRFYALDRKVQAEEYRRDGGQ